MYRYGIAYYSLEGTTRVPVGDADVRLLRPGEAWAEGRLLTQTVEGSGFYEIFFTETTDLGFYEIWDDQVSPSGGFSGRCCLIGPLDARGIQDEAIYTNHLEDGAVSADKIAAGAVTADKLDLASIAASALIYEEQDASDGVGDVSEASPALIETDSKAEHSFALEYSALPLVVLTPYCDRTLYIDQVSLVGSALTVSVGIGTVGAASTLAYTLLVIAREP